MSSIIECSCPLQLTLIALAYSLALAACSGSATTSPSAGGAGSTGVEIGGSLSSGGLSGTESSASGGALGIGGTSSAVGSSTKASSSQGGASAQGGVSNTGGTSAKATSATGGTGAKTTVTTGGTGAETTTATGGAITTGGTFNSTQSSTTGGAITTGGHSGTGGANGPGGASSTKATSTGGTGNAGGSAAAGGTTSAGGSSGATCHPKFASGLNVAWFRFASDIPLQSTDIPKFTTLFQNVKAAGGSAVRWWFHTNGTSTPGYDSAGKAKPISDANIADLKKILDAAHAQGVGVVISLWSFGMLDSGQTTDATLRGYNKSLLENDTNRQAYIDNVLTKMVTQLKGYPGLFAWEIFNEPEGMSSDNGGWTNPTGDRTASVNLQKTVNWFTSAIHNADPAALVTNGANNFSTLSPSHGKNLWSDSALTTAGGKANGVLDFYEVHYYNTYSNASNNSPFLHPVSYWGLDKNVVIGEFWTDTTDGVAAADLYTNLYSSSYSGAWAWQYANTDNPGPSSGASTVWPAMKTPMDNLNAAHPADLTCP